MTHPNKVRGNVVEREVVEILKNHGFTDAQRAWGSDGRAMGEHKDVDVKAGDHKFQCKRKKKIADVYRPSDHVNGTVFREDRGAHFIIVPFKHYCELLRGNQTANQSD